MYIYRQQVTQPPHTGQIGHNDDKVLVQLYKYKVNNGKCKFWRIDEISTTVNLYKYGYETGFLWLTFGRASEVNENFIAHLQIEPDRKCTPSSMYCAPSNRKINDIFANARRNSSSRYRSDVNNNESDEKGVRGSWPF